MKFLLRDEITDKWVKDYVYLNINRYPDDIELKVTSSITSAKKFDYFRIIQRLHNDNGCIPYCLDSRGRVEECTIEEVKEYLVEKKYLNFIDPLWSINLNS